MTTTGQVPWAIFADLQQSLEPRSVDQSLGREEAFNAILEDIVVNPLILEERARKRFATLSRNRSAKYRHRRNVDRDRCRPSCRRGGREFDSSFSRSVAPAVFEHLARAELITRIRGILPLDDFEVLWEIAKGKSYHDVAHTLGISLAAAKTRVFRIRERVRLNAVGLQLLEAFGYPVVDSRRGVTRFEKSARDP